MAEMRQSHQERAALDAAWKAQPQVKKFTADLRAFVAENNLDFDKAGMDASAAFAIQWHKDNGALPDSGIFTG